MSSIASFSSPIAAARLFRPTGPPPNLSMIVFSSRRSASSNPCWSTSSNSSASWHTAAVMRPSARTCAKSRTRRSRRLTMRGVPRDRRAISTAASASRPTPQNPRRPRHDLDEVGLLVEIQAMHDAKARAQRRRQQPGARRRAHQRERLHRHFHRPRARALADHDVELEVLHRRIEDFLDHRIHAVDFVDEQDLARLQAREDARQIARALEHRARCRPHRARPVRWPMT